MENGELVSFNLNANRMRAARVVDGGVGLYDALRAVGLAICLALYVELLVRGFYVDAFALEEP